MEKFLLKKVLDKIPTFIRVFFTVILAVIGWVFFFSPSLGDAFLWLGRMFGIGAAGFLDATGKYYLAGSAAILIIGAFSAYPIGARLGSLIYRGNSKIPAALSVIWFALLLLLCIAGMTSSTYSSFLYFQF